MKRCLFYGVVFSLNCSILLAQSDSVSLLQCLVSARTHALIKPQIETLSQITGLQISGKNATNLPSLSAYGKAWYQSDAVTVSIPGIGDFLEVDKFQYNFGIEADQKIYDGGIARKGKDLDEISSESQINKIEAELYQLNNQVADFFFKSMLLNKNKEVLRLKKSVLNKRLDELESAYENGMISSSELGKMKAELLSTYQKIREIEKYQLQTLSALQILTGLEMDTSKALFVSDSLARLTIASRPEHTYFDAELLKLDKMAGLNAAKNLPKLYAFGQTGYSYPGLNFFENESDYYYIIGARLSWTIFDWNQNKRQTQILRKQKEIIGTRLEEFNQKLEMSANSEIIEQEKLLQLIALDEQIIEQRTLVSAGSATALESGAITTTSYLEDLNAEIAARIELETHKIQYESSLVRMYLIHGIDLDVLNKE
ncbi:MAG: TolC family protein [Bacteroidales bacterium]|nr:TolC family protein [Bacteroidales bacterium]